MNIGASSYVLLGLTSCKMDAVITTISPRRGVLMEQEADRGKEEEKRDRENVHGGPLSLHSPGWAETEQGRDAAHLSPWATLGHKPVLLRASHVAEYDTNVEVFLFIHPALNMAVLPPEPIWRVITSGECGTMCLVKCMERWLFEGNLIICDFPLTRYFIPASLTRWSNHF